MLKNYFVITFRNMVRNKLFTVINILGISISLACCILLFLYATRELSYDQHHGALVYRIISNISQKEGQIFKLGSSSVPVAPALQQEVPEIEKAARATFGNILGGKNLITYEDNSWYIDNGYLVDSSFFTVLKFAIVNGNKTYPLSHNNAVVLEKEWVKKIFGDKDPLGKMVKISTDFGQGDFEVTAVYDKSVYLSHLTPTFFISMSNTMCNSFFNKDINTWVGNNMVFSYVKLVPGSNPESVVKKINDILNTHGGEDMKAMGVSKTMDLQPVQKIHITTGFMVDIPNVTSLVFIQILILIGVLILILACVNYINLSTAQAGNRALEVGIRKVMGVTPNGLIVQFLGESFIIVFISLLLSILLAKLGLPFFNRLIDTPLEISSKYYPILGLYLAGFLLITGLIAGFYPAFYLSSFKPAHVLKGRSREQAGTSLLRKGLVVFQFVISIALISSILVISKQVNFIKNKELGFDKNSRLIIPLNTQEALNQYEILKQKYGNDAMIHGISGASSVPGSEMIRDLLIYKKGQTMDDAIHIYNNNVDPDYFNVLGMKILSGRNFEVTDKDSILTHVLLSEEAVKRLSIKLEDAPGQLVYMDWQGNKMQFEVIGVVNDIHQFSLHKVMDPIIYSVNGNKQYQNMILNSNMDNFQGLISQLQKQWKEVIPNTPFSYFTLDDHLMVQYAKDFNTFNLIKYFAFISVVISCMGLYAMSMFLAERRFREIGIRKAFGAGARNIVIMVSGDLSKLVMISFVLSIPLSIFAMNKWLESFAYRIKPGIGIYLLAGVISLVIAWLTISYQSYRAARTNPVDVLREE